MFVFSVAACFRGGATISRPYHDRFSLLPQIPDTGHHVGEDACPAIPAYRRFTSRSVLQPSLGFHPTSPRGDAVAFRSRLPPIGPAKDLHLHAHLQSLSHAQRTHRTCFILPSVGQVQRHTLRERSSLPLTPRRCALRADAANVATLRRNSCAFA